MKQVLTGHDVRVLVNELQRLNGARLNQVYDVTTRSVCLKLDLNKEKIFLVLDSGAKIYTREEFSSLRPAPTSFCSGLRKHLSNKRIVSIAQIRGDRVIDIQFGVGEWEFHVITELYASGNILITDKDYKILNLLHRHRYDEETVVRAREIYPVEKATQDIENIRVSVEELKQWLVENVPQKKTKLRQILIRSQLSVFGPVVIDHSAALVGIDTKQKVKEELPNLLSDEQLQKLVSVCEKEVERTKNTKGYIVLGENKEFESVVPYDYEHLKPKTKIVYPTFEKACAVYFSKLDSGKFVTETQKKEEKKKIEESPETRAVNSITHQIQSMQEKKSAAYEISELIETKVAVLEQCAVAVRTAVKQRDTDLLEGIVKRIDPELAFVRVDIPKKTMHLTINDTPISLDYTQSVYKSVGENYSKGKRMNKKMERAETALKSVKKRSGSESRKTQQLIEIPGKKKPLWFESFAWFMSSDGYLVVCGKTADDNETLVKKHLEKNDIYVHSDVPGSGSCIIKNSDEKDPPISTLEQAGQFVVCRTKAWKESVGNRAWWVRPDQVSKTPESGEYTTKGSFIIRGKKNFLSAETMELGLGYLFKLSGDHELKYEADENVEYAVPMCAPYSSFRKAKLRVKIKPGSQKIKKGLNGAISQMLSKANIYERSAVKKIANEEYHRVLVTGVRFCF